MGGCVSHPPAVLRGSDDPMGERPIRHFEWLSQLNSLRYDTTYSSTIRAQAKADADAQAAARERRRLSISKRKGQAASTPSSPKASLEEDEQQQQWQQRTGQEGEHAAFSPARPYLFSLERLRAAGPSGPHVGQRSRWRRGVRGASADDDSVLPVGSGAGRTVSSSRARLRRRANSVDALYREGDEDQSWQRHVFTPQPGGPADLLSALQTAEASSFAFGAAHRPRRPRANSDAVLWALEPLPFGELFTSHSAFVLAELASLDGTLERGVVQRGAAVSTTGLDARARAVLADIVEDLCAAGPAETRARAAATRAREEAARRRRAERRALRRELRRIRRERERRLAARGGAGAAAGAEDAELAELDERETATLAALAMAKAAKAAARVAEGARVSGGRAGSHGDSDLESEDDSDDAGSGSDDEDDDATDEERGRADEREVSFSQLGRFAIRQDHVMGRHSPSHSPSVSRSPSPTHSTPSRRARRSRPGSSSSSSSAAAPSPPFAPALPVPVDALDSHRRFRRHQRELLAAAAADAAAEGRSPLALSAADSAAIDTRSATLAAEAVSLETLDRYRAGAPLLVGSQRAAGGGGRLGPHTPRRTPGRTPAGLAGAGGAAGGLADSDRAPFAHEIASLLGEERGDERGQGDAFGRGDGVDGGQGEGRGAGAGAGVRNSGTPGSQLRGSKAARAAQLFEPLLVYTPGQTTRALVATSSGEFALVEPPPLPELPAVDAGLEEGDRSFETRRALGAGRDLDLSDELGDGQGDGADGGQGEGTMAASGRGRAGPDRMLFSSPGELAGRFGGVPLPPVSPIHEHQQKNRPGEYLTEEEALAAAAAEAAGGGRGMRTDPTLGRTEGGVDLFSSEWSRHRRRDSFDDEDEDGGGEGEGQGGDGRRGRGRGRGRGSGGSGSGEKRGASPVPSAAFDPLEAFGISEEEAILGRDITPLAVSRSQRAFNTSRPASRSGSPRRRGDGSGGGEGVGGGAAFAEGSDGVAARTSRRRSSQTSARSTSLSPTKSPSRSPPLARSRSRGRSRAPGSVLEEQSRPDRSPSSSPSPSPSPTRTAAAASDASAVSPSDQGAANTRTGGSSSSRNGTATGNGRKASRRRAQPNDDSEYIRKLFASMPALLATEDPHQAFAATSAGAVGRNGSSAARSGTRASSTGAKKLSTTTAQLRKSRPGPVTASASAAADSEPDPESPAPDPAVSLSRALSSPAPAPAPASAAAVRRTPGATPGVGARRTRTARSMAGLAAPSIDLHGDFLLAHAPRRPSLDSDDDGTGQHRTPDVSGRYKVPSDLDLVPAFVTKDPRRRQQLMVHAEEDDTERAERQQERRGARGATP